MKMYIDLVRSGSRILATMCLVLASSAVHAVNLIDDGRIVTTFDDNGSSQTVPAVPFEPFNVSRQNSVVSSDGFSGTGSGYGESDFFFFIAESRFDIIFETTLTTDIDFNAFLTANSGDFGYANVRVQLFQGADMSALVYSDSVDADFGYEEGMVEYSGTLAPGIYRLVLRTDITPGGFDTTGSWDFTANFTTVGTMDSDSDGIPDSSDNCLVVANADQRDTNGDGYGNSCDPDLDNNGIVNFVDISLWIPFFNTATSGDADFNGDGIASFVDYALYAAYFLQPPGPSGIAP